MKKTLVKWSANLALLLASIFIALLIGECIVRFLYKDKMILFPRYTTNAKYGDFSIRVNRSNMAYKHTSIDGIFHFRTNNRGFRNDKDIEYVKKDNEIRILCLGDSHTLGYEVNQNETFSWVTENLLRQKGLNTTVINAGVAGFGNAEELVFLENEGYKYQPDFVVLGFYGNDFEDNIKSNIFSVQNDSLKVLNFKYLPGINLQNFIYKYKIVHFLGENSYLYAFMFNSIWDFFKKKRLSDKTKDIQTEFAIPNKQEYSQYEYNLTDKIIERMHKFTSKRNIPLIILDIPQIDMKSSIPEKLVNHFINNSDTLFYSQDMLQEYKKLSKTHVPHGDRHISSETHNLLGNKIANYILSHKK
jgi:hypothetical protein